MPNSLWDGVTVIEDTLKRCSSRPRSKGLTMIIDTYLGTSELNDVLEVASEYIDHWKCSLGMSALMPSEALNRKIELLHEHEILSFPGGTLLEAAIVHQNCRPYMETVRAIGFRAVEISDGTISFPPKRRRNTINCALDHDLIPITEVGKKDPASQPSPEILAEQIINDIEWGAEYVVVDARESGCGVGIFDEQGELRQDVLAKILAIANEYLDQIIWEAPLVKQQIALVHRLGPGVNLGNVKPQDVLPLEALRLGLRYETFRHVVDRRERSGEWSPAEVEPETSESIPGVKWR